MIGQGGMGAIYQADDLRLEGRVCAVKETGFEEGIDLLPKPKPKNTVLSRSQCIGAVGPSQPAEGVRLFHRKRP